MNIFDKVKPEDVERREWQLTVFACSAIGVLAIGTAALMYPVAFPPQGAPGATQRIAFVGFCVLCVLLAGYLWDRQKLIRRLRREMAAERRQFTETQRQASVELLKTMPNLSSFQDRLAMEYRRTVVTKKEMSVLVVSLALPPGAGLAVERATLLGDAAKVVFRRLRDQDSIYMLSPACFAVVLPGMEEAVAQRVSDRVSEGLADAAGASHRFVYTCEAVNYPAHASTVHELQEAVLVRMPQDHSIRGMVEALK